MQTANDLNVQKYLDIALKYKWHGLIPACLVMLALGIGSSFLPKIYESACIVEVERGMIENPLKTRWERPMDLRDQLKIFSENVLRWSILSRVIDKVGADAIMENADMYNLGKLKKKLGPAKEQDHVSQGNYAKREAVTKLLQKGIKFRQRQPRFLALTYRGPRSSVNADILNTLVSTLIEEKTRAELNVAGRNYEFIKQELESYRKKLEDAEARLKKFKEKHISELPSNINLHLTQLANDKSNLLACELEMQELTTRLQYVDEELEKQNELIVSEVKREANPMGMVLNERIVDMEIQLTRLRTNYTDLHPRVIEVKGQLEDLKEQRDELVQSTVDSETSMLNPVYQQLAQDKQNTLMGINGLKSRIESLTARIAENEKRVLSTPAQEQQLLTLTRNYEVTANIYNMLLQKVEEVRLQEKLASDERDTESFKVVEYARATLIPVAPEKIRVLLVILIAGAATCFGVISLFNVFDDSLSDIQEAKEFLGKPLLGTIPALKDNGENGPVSARGILKKTIDKP